MFNCLFLTVQNMNPLILITILFIIPYFLNFYIYLYSQNMLTFISTKIFKTFYFHVSVSISIFFLNFHIVTLRNSLKKNFKSQIKTLVPIPYKYTSKNLACILRGKHYLSISETHHSCEKREHTFMVLREYTIIFLFQVIQRLETNSKSSFVILKSWTAGLYHLKKKKKKSPGL